MLTALRSDVQEKRSFEIGVDEYLCKPFDEEVLRLRIRNILSLRRKYKKMFSSSSNVEELHVKEESRDKTFITNAVNLMKEHYADAEYNLERFVRDMATARHWSTRNAGPDGTAHRTVYEELPSERGATDDTGGIGRCECFRNSLCCRIQRS